MVILFHCLQNPLLLLRSLFHSSCYSFVNEVLFLQVFELFFLFWVFWSSTTTWLCMGFFCLYLCFKNPPESLLHAEVWEPMLYSFESIPRRESSYLRSLHWKDCRKIENDAQGTPADSAPGCLVFTSKIFNVSLKRYMTLRSMQCCLCIYVFLIYISSIVLYCFFHFSLNSMFSHTSLHGI